MINVGNGCECKCFKATNDFLLSSIASHNEIPYLTLESEYIIIRLVHDKIGNIRVRELTDNTKFYLQ